METHLDKKVRRQAEKLMGSYRNLEAIIEAQKLEIPQKLTASYSDNESQRDNQFYSDTESAVEYLQEKVDKHIRTKNKLDRLYGSMKPDQQRIWDLRYCDGRTDVYVYNELNMTDRHYYRLKRDMISIVAEAFFLAE